MKLSPRPPCSAGIVAPKSPSSFMVATSACGYSSACSSSDADGITSRSTNRRTAATMSLSGDSSIRISPGDDVRITYQTTRELALRDSRLDYTNSYEILLVVEAGQAGWIVAVEIGKCLE